MDYYFDYSKSLSELEGKDVTKPVFSTSLVQTCYELYFKPLNDFTVEDLRIMIGQNIGLLYLVPLAIEELEVNLLAAGHFYSGDLLDSVINADKDFWNEHEVLKQRIIQLVQKTIDKLNKSLAEFQ